MANTLINILREYIPKKKQMTVELSHAINKKYTCANPSGPVSNFGCPETDPLCNCPCKDLIPTSIRAVTAQWLFDNKWYFSDEDWDYIYYNNSEENPWALIKGVYKEKDTKTAGANNPTYELYPGGNDSFKTSEEEAIEALESAYEDTGGYTMDEPSSSYLNSLLKASSECDAIEGELGSTWLGCDWNDPNSPMSCDCPCVGKDYKKYLRYNTSVATFWDTPAYVPLISSAQKESLQFQKIGITLYGDLSIRPGDIIDLDLMDVPHGFEEIDNIARKYGIITPIERNAKFHGKWMVSSVKHKMYGVSYHKMDIILIRDGLTISMDVPEISEETSETTDSGFVPIAPSGSNRSSSARTYTTTTETPTVIPPDENRGEIEEEFIEESPPSTEDQTPPSTEDQTPPSTENQTPPSYGY